MPSRTLPWAKPRRELLVLALVAVVALSPVYGMNAQDNSRLCLAQAITHGHLSNDGCFGLDHALYKGHKYTDKAPGLSFLELPFAVALNLAPANELTGHPWQVWVIRLLTSGVFFLGCAFLIGRVSEGLAPGFGSIALVTFGLGTFLAPLAAMSFDQVPAAFLGFAAFLLAWRRSPVAAGLLAGTVALFEYEAGAILVILGIYIVLVTRSGRSLMAYAAGAVPALVVLAAYDWLAFGAPWRLSYRYVDNLYQGVQESGFFGIRVPTWYATHEVLAGRGGVIAATPVLVAAAWGLRLLWARHRAEAAVCVAVTGVFLLLNIGYFLPYGGTPGPRFFIPALPFLALGLGPAFAWRPRLTAVLAAVSIASMTAILLVWGVQTPIKGGIFGEVARVPFQLGSSRFVQNLVYTVFDWVTPGYAWGAALVAAFGIAAFVVAYRAIPRDKLRPAESHRSRRIAVLAAATVGLVVAAEASAVSGYQDTGPSRDLGVSIQAASGRTFPGQEADFTVWSWNSSEYQGYGNIVLTIDLPPGATVVGPPSYQRGSGCVVTSVISCNLESLSPKTSTPVRFGIKVTQFGTQTLTALLSAQGLSNPRRASVSIDSG